MLFIFRHLPHDVPWFSWYPFFYCTLYLMLPRFFHTSYLNQQCVPGFVGTSIFSTRYFTVPRFLTYHEINVPCFDRTLVLRTTVLCIVEGPWIERTLILRTTLLLYHGFYK